MAISAGDMAILKEAAAIIKRETAVPGHRVLIRDFGSFERKRRPPRVFKREGVELDVPERTVLRFRPAKALTRTDV